MNETTAIAATDIVEINPLYHFRWEESQEAFVMLYPEGIVKLNETSAAILQLCDGSHTTEKIISELNEKYTTDVTESVNNFMEVSHAKGWIKRSKT